MTGSWLYLVKDECRKHKQQQQEEEATCRIRNNKDETYDYLWLRCPAFDADRKRLDLWLSINELTRFPLRAQAFLWIILRRLR